jgi:hypothetical protein
MNAQTILLAPWRATHRAMAWLSLGVLALCVAIAAGVAIFGDSDHVLWAAVGLYSAALVYLWAFFLSGTALLAIDARWLCIPGMQRTAVLAVGVYALLSLLPTLLLALLGGGDVSAMLLVSTLCVLSGLSFALLPRYIAACMGFLPALYNMLNKEVHLPAPGDPRFVPWGLCAAAALLAICIRRWYVVVSTSPQQQLGMSGAMVLQYRRSQWSGWGGMSGMCSTQQVRQRPDWMQARPDLRHVGPQQPGNALRVALGGWYLPRTLLGHVLGVAPPLLAVAAVGAVMLLIFSQKQALTTALLWPLTALIVGWICMYGSMGLVFVTVMLVQQRWRKANSELSLLALLPGLGNAQASKRDMLRVTLRRPLLVQALALLVLIGMAVIGHPTGSTLLMLVAGQLGCTAALIACVLAILGGRPLPGWIMLLLAIVISGLIGANSFLPSSMIGRHPWEPGTLFTDIVLGGWLLVGLALAWIARRGWMGWRARPHAFMPNG